MYIYTYNVQVECAVAELCRTDPETKSFGMKYPVA